MVCFRMQMQYANTDKIQDSVCKPMPLRYRLQPTATLR